MKHILSSVLAIAMFLPMAAHAQQTAYSAPRAMDRATASIQQDYMVPYAGYFDITQDDNAAAQFGVEYRVAPRYYTLRPAIGFNVSTDGSVYGYGGVFWDLELSLIGMQNWIFTPNFVAGLYHSGDGKKLGGAAEFRSGVELSYVFSNQHRVGVAFNHISNASIYDRNPGAETLLINYHIPVGKYF